jgi:hypothetical protein
MWYVKKDALASQGLGERLPAICLFFDGFVWNSAGKISV